VAFSFVALVTVPLATRSGKRLRDTLELGGPVLEKVQDHQQMGDRVIWAVAPMFAFGLAAMLMVRAGRPTREVTLVGVLASIAALVAVVLVVLTGHLGSQAVWNPAG
jgi:lipopolysaccharide export LptBFGC system permease protein LptF